MVLRAKLELKALSIVVRQGDRGSLFTDAMVKHPLEDPTRVGE